MARWTLGPPQDMGIWEDPPKQDYKGFQQPVLSAVVSLTIRKQGVVRSEVKALAASDHLSSLRELTLRNNALGDEGARDRPLPHAPRPAHPPPAEKRHRSRGRARLGPRQALERADVAQPRGQRPGGGGSTRLGAVALLALAHSRPVWGVRRRASQIAQRRRPRLTSVWRMRQLICISCPCPRFSSRAASRAPHEPSRLCTSEDLFSG